MSGPKNIKKSDKDSSEVLNYKSDSDAAKLERILDFDLYFALKMSKDQRILKHHKAPMKAFAEARGVKQATESMFDEVFKNY